MEKFVVSGHVANILRRSVEAQIEIGLTSPLLEAYRPVLDLKDEELRKKLSQKIEDMFVSVGGNLKKSGTKRIFLADKTVLQDEIHPEFKRRFPIDGGCMHTFMYMTIAELVVAMSKGYRVYGEWGEIAMDDSGNSIWFNASK